MCGYSACIARSFDHKCPLAMTNAYWHRGVRIDRWVVLAMTKHRKDRAELIVETIRDYTSEYGYAPSVRDLMARVDLASPSAVHFHLRRLAKAGRITYHPSLSRTLRVVEADRLDIGRIHSALLASDESGLRYAIDESKWGEAASLIVEADDRLMGRSDVA